MRKTYVFDPATQKMVEKSQFVAECRAPMVMPDIGGYQSMQTGEWIGSRSTHREHLKRHRLIEIGNEKVTPKKMEPDRAGIRRAAENAYRQVMG